MSTTAATSADWRALIERLETLENDRAAQRILAAYATAVDAMNAPALRELYDERSVLSTPMGDFHGTEEILRFFEEAWEADPSAKRHFVTNVATRPSGAGDVALECYFMYLGRAPENSVIGWGNYQCSIDVSGAVFREHQISIDIGTTVESGWATGSGG